MIKVTRILRHLTLWLTRAVIVILLCISLLFGFIQTAAGKRFLAATLEPLIGAMIPGSVCIDTIEGFVPFDISVRQISLQDREGTWLVIQGATLTWSASVLLHRKIIIESLRISSLEVSRLPGQTTSETTDNGATLPSLPAPFPPVTIEQFVVSRCALAKTVAGQALTVSIVAQIQALQDYERAQGFVEISRTDTAEGMLTLEYYVDRTSAPPIFSVKAHVQEDSNGFLATILEHKGAAPATISLEATGSISRWKGTLRARIPGVGEAHTAIGTASEYQGALSIDGVVAVDPLILPPSLNKILGGLMPVRLAFSFDPHETVRLHTASVRLPDAALTVSGSLDLGSGNIEAMADLTVNDLKMFEPLAEIRCGGTGSFNAIISGTLAQPQTMLNIVIQQPQLDTCRAERFEGTIQLSFREAFHRVNLRGSGNVTDFVAPSIALLPATTFAWRLSADVSPEASVTVDSFSLAGRDFSCSFTGALNVRSRHIAGTAALTVPSIGGFIEPWAKTADGSAQLQARLEGSPAALAARIEAVVTDPRTGNVFLDPLLGKRVALSGTFSLQEGSTLTVANGRLLSDCAEAAGEEVFILNTKETQGRWELGIPDLSVLSGAFGKPLAGSAGITAMIAGPFNNPDCALSFEGEDLTVATSHFPHCSASVTIADATGAPRGSLTTTLAFKDTIVSGSANYSFTHSQFSCSDIAFGLPDNKLTGDLIIELPSYLARGAVQASLADLSPVAALFEKKATGSAQATLSFTPGKTGQDVTISLLATSIVSSVGTATRIHGQADLRDIFQSPKGTVEIDLNGLRRERLHVDSLMICAQARESVWSFDATLNGVLENSFSLIADGTVNLANGRKNLTFASLEAQYGKNHFALAQPAKITWSPPDFTVENFTFETAPAGRLTFAGTLQPTAVAGDLYLSNLPVSLIPTRFLAGMEGTVSGNIEVRGRPDSPEAACALQVRNIALLHETTDELPPLSIDIQAQIKAGGGECSFSLVGITERPVAGAFSLPVQFSAIPFSFSVFDQAPIQGNLTGEVNLEHLQSFVPGEDHTFSGLLKTDLALGGTLEAPKLRGTISVENGSYENAWSGTILKSLSLRIAMRNERITIAELNAIGNRGGAVSLAGWIDMAPKAGFPLQATLTINNSTLVQRDDIVAQTSGRIEFTGTVYNPAITGAITVESAEMRIPERLPPDVAELTVIEINRPADQSQPQRPAKMRPPSGLNIDVTVYVPGHLFLRGRGLDSEWKGSLRIAGNTKEVAITGTMSVIRGNYLLFDKRLTLTSGVLIFTGSVPPAPTLNVQAEKQQTDLTSRIRVSGAFSAPKITLESDPPYPPDEILSRLLFGRSVGTITPLQALQLAEVLQTLSGTTLGTLDVMEHTRKLLHVDRLTLEQAEGENGGTSVSLGKYLKEGVYVEMDKGVSENTDRISVEIGITPNLSVESNTGTDAKGGIGINWKVDY